MNLPLYIPVLAPVFVATVGYFLKRRIYQVVLLAFQIVQTVLVTGLFLSVRTAGARYEVLSGWPEGVGIALSVDTISAVLVMLAGWFYLFLLTFNFRKLYMDNLFQFLFVTLQGLLIGLFMASDIFNVYVLLELATIVIGILIMYKRDKQTIYDGMLYLMMNLVSMAFFLLGIGFVYKRMGTLDMLVMAEMAATVSDPRSLIIPYALLLMPVGVKAAFFLLFAWLPRAHGAPSAPSVVSALLSGVQVKAGVYLFIRLTQIFDSALPTREFFLAVGFLTAITGFFLAIAQKDIKLILAYHTVSQVGLIVIGLSAGTDAAFWGGVYHIVNHAFFKALLFLTAGSVMHALSGQLDMRKMSGLARKMPVTAVLMLIGCLALAGFPFTAGFFSKDQILYNALNTYPVLGWLAVLTALLTAFYTFRLWFRVFMGPTEYEMGREHHGYEMDHAPDDHHHGPHEMSWLMNGPLVVLAAGAVFAGLFFGGWMESSIKHATPGIAAAAVQHDEAVGDPHGDADHAHPHADQNLVHDHDHAQDHDHAAVPAGLLHAPKHKGDPGYISHLAVGLISGLGAIVMIVAAGYFFWLNRPTAARIAAAARPAVLLAYHKYFVDEAYRWLIVAPLKGLGWVGYRIVDALLLDRLIYDGLARFIPRLAAEAQTPTMRGRLQGYALLMGLGLLLVVAIVAYAVML